MKKFTIDLLKIDAEQETCLIVNAIKKIMRYKLKRRGLVLGLSGGIDSSVTAALAVKALGPSRVFGLEMPERHSASDTLFLSTLIADHLGISTVHEDISCILEGFNFYKRYDAAVKSIIPEYGSDWKSKIVISGIMEEKRFSMFSLVAESPDKKLIKKILPLKAYLEIVASTNFKQRVRKVLEYYHADRLNFAVAGTPNRLEYDQGFFVKQGDGAADIKPIAHLYKTQVYELAKYLKIPMEISSRPPTTDTYSLPQSQDEFYFALPYKKMDICLYGKNHGYLPEDIAPFVSLTQDQVQFVYNDIDNKRRATGYQHLEPQLIKDVVEIKK